MVLAARMQGDTLGNLHAFLSELVDLRKQSNVFSDILGSQVDIGGLSYDGKANQFVYSYVTGNYFSALGVQPALGRLVTSSRGRVGRQDPSSCLDMTSGKKPLAEMRAWWQASAD